MSEQELGKREWRFVCFQELKFGGVEEMVPEYDERWRGFKDQNIGQIVLGRLRLVLRCHCLVNCLVVGRSGGEVRKCAIRRFSCHFFFKV